MSEEGRTGGAWAAGIRTPPDAASFANLPSVSELWHRRPTRKPSPVLASQFTYADRAEWGRFAADEIPLRSGDTDAGRASAVRGVIDNNGPDSV